MESMHCRHRKFTPECLSTRRQARVEKIQLRSRNKLQNGIAQIEAAAAAAADYVPRIKLGSLDYFQKSAKTYVARIGRAMNKKKRMGGANNFFSAIFG